MTTQYTLYADDTELHASDCTAASAAASVNCYLVTIDKWLSSNHMVPNPDKSLVMKIGSISALKSSEVIDVRNQRLKEVTTAKYHGVHVDSALSWNDQLTKLCTEIYPILCFLNRLSHFLSHETLLKICKQIILPTIDYGSIIWIDCSKVMSDKLERLQNQALRSILKKDRKTCT